MTGGRARSQKKKRALEMAERLRREEENANPDLAIHRRRRLGVLKLTPQQHKKILRRSNRPQKNLDEAYLVCVDLENLVNDLVNVDVAQLRLKVARFLGGNCHIYKQVLFGVGNMHLYKNVSSWSGWDITDVYPRDCVRAICDTKYQHANHHLRPPVFAEKKTDIAHDYLEQLMFTHRRDFGPGCKIMLITGDSDFVRPLKVLQRCGALLYLAKPMICSKKLEGVPNIKTVLFSDILRTTI